MVAPEHVAPRSVLDQRELLVDGGGVAVADDLLQERCVVEDEIPERLERAGHVVEQSSVHPGQLDLFGGVWLAWSLVPLQCADTALGSVRSTPHTARPMK